MCCGAFCQMTIVFSATFIPLYFRNLWIKEMEELFNYIKKFGLLNAQDELLIAEEFRKLG
jgi:hypothetical protein